MMSNSSSIGMSGLGRFRYNRSSIVHTPISAMSVLLGLEIVPTTTITTTRLVSNRLPHVMVGNGFITTSLTGRRCTSLYVVARIT